MTGNPGSGAGAVDRREAIAAIGRELGPEVLKQCMALFGPEQRALARSERRVADLPYGTHPRQCLDLYLPEVSPPGGAPVLLFVHGGGFVRGEKHSTEHPFGAHVGRFAARHGFVGAVMGYRLAPEWLWPSGGDDVTAAVDWLVTHVAAHGGDPSRIVLLGTSAGAVHAATSLKRAPRNASVRAVALLSGLFGATPHERQDQAYFGPAAWEELATLDALAAAEQPLFLACAEFDPPRFQREWLGAMQRRLETKGSLPQGRVVCGHNHYTLAMHLGSSDSTFGEELIGFALDATGLQR